MSTVGCDRPFESDHRGEFVEGCRGSEVAAAGFDTEFVVAAAQVLDERVAADHHRRSPIGLEAAHRSEPGLDSTVVALDAVVRELVGVVVRVRDQLLDTVSNAWARSATTSSGSP